METEGLGWGRQQATTLSVRLAKQSAQHWPMPSFALWNFAKIFKDFVFNSWLIESGDAQSVDLGDQVVICQKIVIISIEMSKSSGVNVIPQV